MSDASAAAVQALVAWLSPGYPVGAFAYSHGLERAVADGAVRDAQTLQAWVGDVLARGSGRNDAILLAAAHRAPDDLAPAELAAALAVSRERLLETEAQGAAFARTTAQAWGAGDGGPAPYPVAVGRAAAAAGAPLETALTLYLQAFAANLVSVAVRLVPLGQTEGQRALAALAPLCAAVAAEAAGAGLDDLGGAAFAADIAAMRHETQAVRLFRT
ncbi:urease accessory protein UreF [Rubrimonas cliftonensis]|uniref:Urease accessory protein UreF n=1 Tax=Rubrimonas cliftonensis TaxID=89524 RepID=A0A1H4B4W4_9RHOB|nr:urease accessory UreF family protein [Rubrimonas cliftonensis]SEA43255.1 urease accessory protein [Rubrimonas cliftonensis]